MSESPISLDDPHTYSRLDHDDMYRLVGELPGQIEDAWQRVEALDLPDDYASARSVLIAGMGGSAIGGSLLQAYAEDELPVPVEVWRNYGLPAWVGEHTLVIAVSYSGATEETLSALTAAHERGAKVIVISTGGKARQLAQEWGVPYLGFEYPAQPRASIGYLFTPLLRIAERLNFLPSQDSAVREAIEVVRQDAQRYGAEAPSSENPAKQLAKDAHGRAVVVYGAAYLAAVARRWKTQMNENAKTWAFYEEFPELDHNAIVGYEYPKALGAAMQVVVLDGSDIPQRIRLRMEVTQQLLSSFGVNWTIARAGGEGKLAQTFSLISLGDYTSYYLALLNGADPTSIAPINFLKDALARAQTSQGVPPAAP